jgi:hypothetical protein
LSSTEPPPEPPDPNVSRRRFLTHAGVALGAVPLIGLARVEDALATPPPTVYDVTAYGAQGDGTADDSNAIQAAIDAANARGGGTIVFPAGTFRITRALTIYSKVVFRGAGARATVIKKGAGGGQYPILKSPGYDPPSGEPTPIHSFSLQNISLDGSRAGGSLGNGLQVYAHGFTLMNVSISACAGRGIWCEFHGASVNNLPLEAMLVNVHVHECTDGGIYWNGPIDSKWIHVVTYLCGPPGIENGSTTKGVHIGPQGNGLRISNSHVWGLNHAYAWYIESEGVGLVSCMGEGAEVAQVMLSGHLGQIIGGQYFALRADHQTVGIEIGHVDLPAPAFVLVQTTIIHCELGALKFRKDGGVGRYQLSVYQTAGRAVVVAPGSQMQQSNRLDIQLSGGATYGDLGMLEPVTFQEDVLMRGDVRAGSKTSKLGFFGAPAQPRSAAWSVAHLPDSRRLDATADLTQVRAVLATLLRDLQRYGLLGASVSRP